jgi:two-component system NtrC family sensor kinase
MEPNSTKDNKKNGDKAAEAEYSGLFRKFILIALVSSVVPLLLVGWGMNRYYSAFAKARMTENFQERID